MSGGAFLWTNERFYTSCLGCNDGRRPLRPHLPCRPAQGHRSTHLRLLPIGHFHRHHLGHCHSHRPSLKHPALHLAVRAAFWTAGLHRPPPLLHQLERGQRQRERPHISPQLRHHRRGRHLHPARTPEPAQAHRHTPRRGRSPLPRRSCRPQVRPWRKSALHAHALSRHARLSASQAC